MYILIYFILFSHKNVIAQEIQLNDVLDSVDKHFPLLLAALKDKTLAETELKNAQGSFDPVLKLKGNATPVGYYRQFRFDSALEQATPFWGTSATLGYRLGFGDFADYDGKLQTNSLGEIRAGLQIPILKNGYTDRRRTNIERAEQGIVAADQQIKQQYIEYFRLAAQRYVEYVGAHHRFDVSEKLHKIAQERDEQLKKRVNKGDIARIDQIDNQRLIIQRQGFMLSQKRLIENTGIELGLYFRDQNAEPYTLKQQPILPQFPNQPLPTESCRNEHLKQALLLRPDLLRLQTQIVQNQIELKFSKNQLLPNLDLNLGVSKDFGTGYSSKAKTEFDIGLSFEFPLLLRQAQSKIQATQASIQKLEFQHRFIRDRITADIKDAYSALSIAHARVVLAQEEFMLSQTVENAERTKFQQGDSTLIFVNLREQSSAETQIKYIDARVDYHRAFANYLAAIGQDHRTYKCE